jgi:hypothetical protein
VLDLLAKLADFVGITGVILILVAYFLLSTGRWIADSFRFQFLNFIGAWFILYSLYFHWNLSSVVIEIAWIIISMVGMYRLLPCCTKKSS